MHDLIENVLSFYSTKKTSKQCKLNPTLNYSLISFRKVLHGLLSRIFVKEGLITVVHLNGYSETPLNPSIDNGIPSISNMVCGP